MNDIFQKHAKLRELYPDDIKELEAEEVRTKEALQRAEFSNLPVTRELLARCKQDIVMARMKLATVRNLPEEARRELWGIIDARLWFVQMAAHDYQAELSMIDQELDAHIQRAL